MCYRKTVAAVVSIFILITVMPCIVFGISEEILMNAHEPTKTTVETTKNGLVEIQTGLMDGDSFQSVRKCNGFLINNTEGEVYVVTTGQGIRISSDDRDNADVEENASRSIRIIVRDDVVSELSEVAISKNQDFCILKADNVVQSKGVVTLRDATGEEAGQQVHTLGFPSEKESGKELQYEASEVESISGVTSIPTRIDGASYIRHSGTVPRSFDGSVLVDDNGFVIGMNSIAKSDGDSTYALEIAAIERVLDDYGIPYATNLTEKTYAQLYERCKQGIKQSNQSRYKAEGKQELNLELEYSAEVLTEYPCNLDKLLKANERLEGAQKGLKTKIPKLVWIDIALGVLLLALLIRFLKLLIWRRRTGVVKEVKQKRNKEKEEHSEQITDDDLLGKTIVPRDNWSTGRNGENKIIPKTISLYWIRKGQQIHIDKTEFIIGKKKEAVDFAIEDNRLISRVHAAVQVGNSGCRIVDLKSSNGTYVNEQPVMGSSTELHQGDLVRIANEEFIVQSE